MKRIAIIMAGGNGTRFWPISRQERPKQFQAIGGQDTLLNETIKRISNFIPMKQIFIVAGCHHKALLEETLPDTFSKKNILMEPMAKNTAGAIAASVQFINNHYADTVIGIFPADHYISNKYEFTKVLEEAYDTAYDTCKMVMLGVTPTYPATGYGYLKTQSDKNPIKKIAQFVEKPDYDKACSYLSEQNYYWNSGIIITKSTKILKEIYRFMPELYFYSSQISYWHQELISGALKELYEAFPSQSIDYGVLEHCNDLLMIKLDVGWSDLGSWDALPEIMPTDNHGNVKDDNQLLIDTENTLVMADKKFVATIGLKDIIVVETKDSLLICKKGHSQDIKFLVQTLKEQGRYELI